MNLNKSLKLAAADDRKKIVVASDGRLDESKPASIATLTCTKDVRLALITEIPQALQGAWSHRVQFIDLVERSAVITALTLLPGMFAQSDILWFIDNSVALAGLARGANSGIKMDRGCAVFHLLLAHLQADAWWEYVESEANWSDGASREGMLNEGSTTTSSKSPNARYRNGHGQQELPRELSESKRYYKKSALGKCSSSGGCF